MKTLHILYHLARADFYERVRRFSFLLILAAVIYMGVQVNTGKAFLALGPTVMNPLSPGYRGEFNSAWIGTMTVLLVNFFLGLFGFYLINDCIQRDIRTGVGQIIATTPISRATYLVGKWISNMVVLSVLVLILAFAAAIMVLLRGEAALELSALLMPFLAVALPNMALIAAFAVVFETVPRLRGAVGNAVYIILFMISATYSVVWSKELPFLNHDPIGVNVFRASLFAGAEAAFPNETIGRMTIGMNNAGMGEMINTDQFKIFNWPGLAWTPGIVGGQWFWAVFGLGLILLSSLWFARFDPSREKLRRARGKTKDAEEVVPIKPRKRTFRMVLPTLSPLISKLAQVSPFLGVLFAELRMLLNGRRWWWWLVIAGLNIAILATPLSMVKEYLLPLAWLWPLPIWSEMGNRERKNNTYQMVFSSARPLLRQLPAAWLAGVLATALFGIAGVLVFFSNGDLPGLAGWVGAVFFIPTLALALGVFSSGSRVFEIVYLLWWYIGPWQKAPGLDFIAGAPQIYLTIASGLLLLCAYWRGRQVHA
jgi:ABC-type transport system involved in multi-copper enzyme maturation permease subunit